MAEFENTGSFLDENKRLLKEYAELRVEIYRLRLIRMIAKSGGYLLWLIVSLFLAFLLLIFLGLVCSFWLSGVFGSYVTGFGITSLGIVLVIVLAAAFRKALFVNPIINNIIRQVNDREDCENDA